MNYLAHLFLADDSSEEALIGALLPDFLLGGLPPGLSDNIMHSVRLHHNLDRFTDRHPRFVASKRLVAWERQRFAGVIVDVCYDHFLATNWASFSNEPLDAFSHRVYRSLEAHQRILTPRLAAILPRMKATNWLWAYRNSPSVEAAFVRMASRSPRLAPLAQAGEDLTANYRRLQDHFLSFFPEAIVFARNFRASCPPRPCAKQSTGI